MPQDYPKITLVTPSYNQGKFLGDTIKSVLAQSYPNLEYIIIDGNSHDDSINIIRQYDTQLSGWVSERDNGQANAINKGFTQSSGQIMGWLNSDDRLMPGALRRIAYEFQRNPQIDVVCGFRQVAWTDGKRQQHVHLQPERFTLSRCAYIAQETTYWRRHVWETLGGLDESYHYCLDYEYWQRMLAQGYKFTLLPQTIGWFRKHEEAKGSRLDHVRATEISHIYQKYLGSAKDEKTIWQEIPQSWWQATEWLKRLAHYGWLNHATLARVLVATLSKYGIHGLPES